MTSRVLCLVASRATRRELNESLSDRLAERSISVVSSPKRALTRLETASFDGVVVGHDEPSLDAVAVLEQLRERYPSLPVVVFPQDGSEALASAVLGAGATDYVRRADGYDTLADRLERALDETAMGVDHDCHAIPDALEDAGGGSEPTHRLHRLRSFRKAVEQAGHSIYITEPDGTIRYVNPAFEETTGYSADEAIGMTPRLLKSGVHGPLFYRELWQTILAGEVWDDQIVNRRRDGTEYTVNQTIAPIMDEDGDIVNFVAVNADISEQKRREAQLRQLHEAVCEWLEATTADDVARRTVARLEDLLEHELHAVFLADDSSDQLRPAAVSAAADDTFETHPRFDEDDGIAWQVFETGTEAIYDDVREVDDVYNTETAVRSEIILPLGDHGVLLVSSRSVAAFEEPDSMLLRIVASSLEATLDRISREQELERQKDRFEKFAHVVSHDLRNPLTIAMGELERARETDDDAAFEAVIQAHKRIADIVDDLLWLAREGRTIADPQPVSVASVASNAWEIVNTPDVSLELACDRRILADPGRLQQLFENLFRNAVEHGFTQSDFQARQNGVEHDSSSSGRQIVSDQPITDSERIIRVGLTDDGFYVADTGVGIPESERERILESGYTTADNGTGLGLSIVRTIVDSHDWDLEITDSEAGGARFEIQSGFVD